MIENIENVVELFDFIASRLTPGGQVLIQVPYSAYNPFDFVIADHVWHFSKRSLASLLNKSHFVEMYMGNESIEKELTALIVPGERCSLLMEPDEERHEIESIAWLLRYKTFLEDLKKDKREFAVYGTGPAGAWTGLALGNHVIAYVDDDPARVHSKFNGKPILSPQEISKFLPVIAAFPDHHTRWIAKKNKDLNIVSM